MRIDNNKEPDLIVDKNGKVLKVNDDFSEKELFFFDTLNNEVSFTASIYQFDDVLQKELMILDYYITYEACEKAVKRKEVENKLRFLAFELNGNREITEKEWKDYIINKFYLQYQHYNKKIECKAVGYSQTQGTIFCLDKDFKDKAIELIGEEDLKDYLING